MTGTTGSNVTYDFSDKVVLVTGGARGQGRSHALGFARAGADVVIGDIGEPMDSVPYQLASSDQLNEVAEEIAALGAGCLPAICDVRHAAQVDAMVADAIDEFGHIDVLVNNAGVESLPTVQEMSEQEWDEVIDTMLKGTFLCTKAVIATMIERGGGGRVITTGSTASTVALPRQAHYTAAKHGVVGFSRSLALEVAEHGITVNVVCPGAIDTPMVEGMLASRHGEWFETVPAVCGRVNLFNPEEMLDPQEITNAMMWLASDAARFVTGTLLTVDAGYTIK